MIPVPGPAPAYDLTKLLEVYKDAGLRELGELMTESSGADEDYPCGGSGGFHSLHSPIDFKPKPMRLSTAESVASVIFAST
jgi:hypothetical protein